MSSVYVSLVQPVLTVTLELDRSEMKRSLPRLGASGTGMLLLLGLSACVGGNQARLPDEGPASNRSNEGCFARKLSIASRP